MAWSRSPLLLRSTAPAAKAGALSKPVRIGAVINATSAPIVTRRSAGIRAQPHTPPSSSNACSPPCMRVARNAGCAASSVSVGTRWPTGWKKKGDELPAFETSVAPAQKGDVLEADAMWSFVRKKSRKRWIWFMQA